jgi:hypothetical protein
MKIGDTMGRKQAARTSVGFARGSGFSPPVDQPCRRDRAQPIAVRRPWQRFKVAGYTMAPGSQKNGGRDHASV